MTEKKDEKKKGENEGLRKRTDGWMDGWTDGRTEGRKEASEHEEGVSGEVSRGRGAISRLSIMEPVRSYREARGASEEPAFHPTNLS